MGTPKVSIIVPVYNAGSYFSKLLDSLTGQTLKEIEIILVLDCPTDGSDRVAEEYAARKTEEILSKGRDADRGNQLIGVVNACIMIFATIIFLVCGLGFDLWEKCWIAYPVGVLLCGIVSIILNFIYNRK